MFYNYDLLCQRAGGKFSLVWLAATRKSLPANDYLRINVVKTCLDIMETVKNQEPRMSSKNARSRFSLYLSSMLLYGVCIVYRQQVIITIDNMMNLFHLTITCNGTHRHLEVSGDGEENGADGAKRGRKRKKQHQLQPVDEKFLAELTVPLKAPPQGIAVSPRFSPNSHPPTVAMPPDVMQTLKVPQMILDDQGTDAPVEQICEQLTKIFAAEELLVSDSQKTEQPLIEDKHVEDQAAAPVHTTETLAVHVAVAESVASAVPTEKAESVDGVPQADKDVTAAPALLEQAYRSSDVKPPSPPKILESVENKEDKIHSIDADAGFSHQTAINLPDAGEPVTDHAEAKGISLMTDNDKTKTEPSAARASRRRASPEQLQEIPQKRKRRINNLLEDEEVEISKHLLRIQIGKDDSELRASDIEKEIKSYVSQKNTKFLIENPCCLDLPEICQILITKTFQMGGGQLHEQQRKSNLEESVEIQRGQRTPTPPQSPLQSLRGEGSSLLRNEVSDITPRLQPIIETHFEELEVPTKADSVINVAPLTEIPEIDISDASVGKEKRDSNLEKVVTEIAQQREAEHGDVEMMQLPVVESSVTNVISTEIIQSAVCDSESDRMEVPTDAEKISKPLKETMNVWRRLKDLQRSINRAATVYDLCPQHSTTKFRAAFTFKCLLELDFRKKVVLQQDRSIPFGPIYISLP
ncbi:meiotic recombination protein REC8 homolog [Schistocerca serialis cubense]|uniref:meiotic recombination protein REC8 homolog n=1 Tax=Schistocerca serialis cubense TaxID=2023355 RepID=UPI00214E088B|nr:meiotic recombination protein REC8 homolog [Schistocerca serialis cubense]